MFLKTIDINPHSVVSDMVSQDYRTASIFTKHGIDYCCGGKRSISSACEDLGVDLDILLGELEESVRNLALPNSLEFSSWDIDFLIDYIRNVHHQYLYIHLPGTESVLHRFVEGHKVKYHYLPELLASFRKFKAEMLAHLDDEESKIFPYIRQVAHAYEGQETYASLLVRTLRKPVEHLLHHEHEHFGAYLEKFRTLTGNYAPPSGACAMHKVALGMLRELDADLVQHMFLENDVLFPRAVGMEKEMLSGMKNS